jgi:hypothetical protein
MFRRRLFTTVLIVFVAASAGVAGWQFVEKDKVQRRLSLLNNQLVDAQVRLESAATEVPAAMESELVDLKAELGAARQQLSVAETAAKETEDRLAEEISRRAAAEAKNKELADALDAAEAKAERAVSELAKIEAVLPASRLAPRDLVADPVGKENAGGPETTASIGKSDEADKKPAAGATAPSQTAAEAQPEKKPAPRTVRRKKKSEPKTEYFLDSLFN